MSLAKYLTSHKSLASTIVSGFRPMSDQLAVTVAFDELLFHKTTATLLLLRGPALQVDEIRTRHPGLRQTFLPESPGLMTRISDSDD